LLFFGGAFKVHVAYVVALSYWMLIF